MDALRSYLSPARKKSRGEDVEPHVESDDEEELFAETTAQEEVPGWARKQEQLMLSMMGMMTEIKNDVGDLRKEVHHVKLQAGIALSTAEETAARVQEVEDRIKDVENTMVTRGVVDKMIADALANCNQPLPWPKAHDTSDTQFSPYSKDANSDDKFARTVVVGGFEQDSEKDDVVQFIKHTMLLDTRGVQEVYAYNFGNVGFIRFDSLDSMWS